MTEEDRHSHALEPELISDPGERARQEASNGLLLYDAIDEQIENWLQPDRIYRLRPSHLLSLHRITLKGLSSYAGNFRPAGIEIQGSRHTPPGAHLVPEKVEDMCDYVNANQEKSPIHLAAYVLWRLNWIHPFTDGNGRTARALSYLVLCVRLRLRLPGTNTVPEQISANKEPYYKALEAADESDSMGKFDLSEMEEYLSNLFANQLYSVHGSAKGNK
jgi:Fic family protein